MKKYFKIVGIIELIGWLIGVIIYLIRLGDLMKSEDFFGKFLLILLLITLIVLGPAIGFLFLWVADATQDPYTSLSNEYNFVKNKKSKQSDNKKDVADISIYKKNK